MTVQQASPSRAHRDETGVIPRLARAAREVESSVQRRAASRTGRTKLQTVAILVREERARIKADPNLSSAKRAEELKRLDGIALILAKSASKDPTLLPLLGEGAPVSDAVRSFKREVLLAAGLEPEPEPEPQPVAEEDVPQETSKRVVPPSVAASQLARPFLEPDLSLARRKPDLDRLAGFDLLDPLFLSFEVGADGRPACMELPETGTARAPKGLELMQHQERFVAAAQNGHRSFLLADEPGLGKTAQALLAASAAKAYPLVVVAPNVVKVNWAREAERWTPGRSVTVVQGDGSNVDGFADIVIVNYEVLDRHVGWMTKHGFRGMVVDEAHFIKNSESKRSKHVVQISKAILERDARALMLALTGTPLINDIEDFRMIWKFLGWIDDKQPNAELTERLEATELTPMDRNFYREARKAVIDMGIVRRRKEDVAADIPERRIADLPVELDESSARDIREVTYTLTRRMVERYDRVLERQELPKTTLDEDLMRRIARSELDSDDGASQEQNVFSLVRQIGKAKATLAADYAAQLARSVGKVVFFAKHIDVMDEAERHFRELGIRHTSIRGDQTSAQRQTAIDAFVEEESVQIIVCSLQAAGVGVNLQVASNMVLAELSWTNAEQTQAIDRIHRIGQDMPVVAWRIVAAQTVDTRIAELIDSKASLAAKALDGSDTTAEDSHDLQENALFEMLRESLADRLPPL
ncbi:MAG TPA: DEAD/DEAH box helicase [Candidatus Agrococcus pullicola]|uniref:DEAD/DEAH box helicase n=1 Tax=Candidatus Agrococcus pullicola TaxID=2838429 RepID=A0A9D2C843_9MICO|nr:DEAD/DEAH box helicase [Candidatus Agrococcus pullicola]